MTVVYYIVIVNNDYELFSYMTDSLDAAYEVALSHIDKGRAADVQVYCTVERKPHEFNKTRAI